MAIPKIKEQDIIDENGVPFHNQSTKYALVTEDGQIRRFSMRGRII